MSRGEMQAEEADPEPAAEEFADRIRRLVDRSGLSVGVVADRTGFARASWDRYLSGRLLPPKAAVIRLAEVVGADQARLVALWETAERAWDRAGGGAEAQDGRSAPPQRAGSGRSRTGVLVAGTIGIALVVLAVVLLIGPGGDRVGGSAAAPASPSEPPWSLGPGPSASPSDTAPDSPSPSATAPSAGTSPTPRLPAGVHCTPGSCAGKDPQISGCAGAHARTVADAHVGGVLVELRRSDVCRAVWTRVTAAVPGDTLRLQPPSGGGSGARIDGGVLTYTAMVDASSTRGVRACLTDRSGRTGCATGR